MNMSLFSAVEPKQHKVYQHSKTNADLGAGSLSRINKVDSCFSLSANKNTHGKFASIGEKHNRDKCNVKCPWKFRANHYCGQINNRQLLKKTKIQLLIEVQANITSRRKDFFKHFASHFLEVSVACSYNIE